MILDRDASSNNSTSGLIQDGGFDKKLIYFNQSTSTNLIILNSKST